VKQSAAEKWIQRAHQKSPDDAIQPPKEWIKQVINEAEKNGDAKARKINSSL
jgi:hypothetical protein